MKAKDLMLNDLVLYRGEVAKVIAIAANGEVSLLVDGHIVARFVCAEELFPIPITAEILEKNGLSKLVTYGTEKWVCDKFRLNEYDNKGAWAAELRMAPLKSSKEKQCQRMINRYHGKMWWYARRVSA